jgi:hypothetical protein
MRVLIDEFSFEDDGDFLDVTVHHGENWIELKTETTGKFPIESQKDLDMMYKKLTEVFTSFEKNKK